MVKLTTTVVVWMALFSAASSLRVYADDDLQAALLLPSGGGGGVAVKGSSAHSLFSAAAEDQQPPRAEMKKKKARSCACPCVEVAELDVDVTKFRRILAESNPNALMTKQIVARFYKNLNECESKLSSCAKLCKCAKCECGDGCRCELSPTDRAAMEQRQQLGQTINRLRLEVGDIVQNYASSSAPKSPTGNDIMEDHTRQNNSWYVKLGLLAWS